MEFFTSLFKSPKAPSLPAVPTTPSQAVADAKAKDDAKRRLKARQGSQTIFTSPLGLSGMEEDKKTKLGQ